MSIQYQAYNRRYRNKMIGYVPMPVAIAGLIAIALCIGGAGLLGLGHPHIGAPMLFIGLCSMSLSLLYWVFLSYRALLTTYMQGHRLKRRPDNSEGVL